MRKNAALAKWRAGQQTVGGWLSLANTHVAELMANAGFDWLCLDLQHGLLDYQDLLHMLPAISTTDTTPLVRVSGNDPKEIMKALDAGAMGVIVPLVNNRAEAAAAVAACSYPPLGIRSYGPTRAALYGGRNYAAEANDEIACIAMIETKDGIAHLEEIVTTPRLGGIYIGPSRPRARAGAAAPRRHRRSAARGHRRADPRHLSATSRAGGHPHLQPGLREATARGRLRLRDPGLGRRFPSGSRSGRDRGGARATEVAACAPMRGNVGHRACSPRWPRSAVRPDSPNARR